MIRRVWVGLGLALVLVAGVLLSADGAKGHIPIPESALIRIHGGVVYENWPANDRWFAHAVGRPAVPPGFSDELVATGFDGATALRFLPDGSIFVIEQRGTLVHYRMGDAKPDRIVIDLREEVLNLHQMGMLGLAVDPEFETEPYVYLLYTRDAVIGGDVPTYGNGMDADPCPELGDCPTSARLVRFRLDPNSYAPAEDMEVLIEDWCAQAGNHTIGTIAFDQSGALLAGGGDGADGRDPDYGQYGSPDNACGDPPEAAGDPVSPPTTEGGALRSQDLRFGNDPVGLSGTIIRVDRRTGVPLPDNPLASATDENARRIVAYGLRNPYRFTVRPGTDEVWIGDVGWNTYEELDLIDGIPTDAPPNFGWPCFEGPHPQPAWVEMGTHACADLYANESELTFPVMSFAHAPRTRKRGCNVRSSALAAITFYDGDKFPSEYHGALFFSDLSRTCVFVIQADANGRPDTHTARQFARQIFAVDLVVGPDGALYYVDVFRGELRRITYRG